MSQARELHHQAMSLLDESNVARMTGNYALSDRIRLQAFDNEQQAANLLKDRLEVEPTRSILFKGAAILAMECGLMREAERLIASALAGNPPEWLVEELRDLLDKVNFHRHLDLRGISLAQDELQVSMLGNAIGSGIASSSEVIERQRSIERLVYRTEERKRNIPFHETGPIRKEAKEAVEVFVSVPRAASFAITFKLGYNVTQPQLPGIDDPSSIIDDILQCFDLFNRSDEEALKDMIPEESYFRNFVGLAQQIAPDGDHVKLVGFTAIRSGSERRVELTRIRESAPSEAQLLARPRTPQRVSIVGELRFAHSKVGTAGSIKIVDSNQKSHKVIVPEGMMSDIVRPMYEDRVRVTGTKTGKGILLEDIQRIVEG